ncbi:MAG: hypothetical protein PVH65_02590 [Chloroflexota bacterium]|jgi:hypothetical protein
MMPRDLFVLFDSMALLHDNSLANEVRIVPGEHIQINAQISIMRFHAGLN